MALLESGNRLTNKPTHRRNDSDELDVFEAARYFSGGAEAAHFISAAVTKKAMKEERPAWEGGRKSLDMNMQDPLPSESQVLEKSVKEKKSRQPSSPGGRLASFLNSLFSQTSSSKKKSKSKAQSAKDEEESPGGRRKRRSSISHFQSIGSKTDVKSMYSSSNSGFRTPPPYSHTPTKAYKDPISYSDQKKFEKKNMDSNSVSLDNTFKFSDGFLERKQIVSNGFLEKDRILSNGFLEKDRAWVDEFSLKKETFRKNVEAEDGCESDSSSDLFELQNYDLGLYSNGLPVYETTHMERIKRGEPIASAT